QPSVPKTDALSNCATGANAFTRQRIGPWLAQCPLPETLRFNRTILDNLARGTSPGVGRWATRNRWLMATLAGWRRCSAASERRRYAVIASARYSSPRASVGKRRVYQP